MDKSHNLLKNVLLLFIFFLESWKEMEDADGRGQSSLHRGGREAAPAPPEGVP